MTGKFTAILAAMMLIAVGAAVFVYGGPGMTGSDSASTSDSTTTISQTDDDDSCEDDSSTWSGTDVVVDAASGITLTYVSGTEGCYTITQNSSTGEYTISFSGITEDTVYLISGTLKGCITVDVSEDFDFKLGLNGVSITSSYSVPISCTSADHLVIAAMEGTDRKSVV